MTLDDVFKLVDQNTKDYRTGSDYQLPAGKLRSIIEVAYLAGEAETRSRQPSAHAIGDQRLRKFEPGERRGCVQRKYQEAS